MNTVNTASTGDFDAILQHTRQCSRYIQRLLDSGAGWEPWLRDCYATPCSATELKAWLDDLPGDSEETLSRSLRIVRKRAMLKLLTRDLGGLADLDEVMTTMTALAELSVQRAQALLMKTLGTLYGSPVGNQSNTPQELLIIGMGKLGGGELNVSSDIDLIFIYPEDGDTDGARSISNHEFFSRLGRKLINLINEPTGDGYVFRVDMRLRPYGDSGPLVMSFAALEEYLVSQGREWERYAWIKARVISPTASPAAEELMRLSRPFVFRKYLDYGAFASMRKLHAQIRQEVQRRDRLNNVKLGPGGIREIEFTAQVFQLIRGGRDAKLRIRPTQRVLQLLAENNQLTADTVARLDQAYVFLRNLEHRLQYLDDQQTQDMPDKPEEQAIIAQSMGFADYAALMQALDIHREFVSQQFELIFSTAQDTSPVSSPLWREGMSAAEAADTLGEQGYSEATDLGNRLLQIREGSRYRQLPESSRQRFDRLVPQFAALCAAHSNRDKAFTRILTLLESISRRASYLAFLAEYPQVLPRLVNMAAASEWACDYLVQHPILLDELLDAREIYRAPDWPALDRQLQTSLDECGEDTEHQMDVLRQFQHSQTFHLLAMDLQGLLPLETLSDHLSDLADLILRHVLALCWKGLRTRHRDDPRFAIIAYGKLGGRELGYASDLDLIFLYEDDAPDAGVIYARLGQRINTLLSSYTASGRLYEVDLRLRPNGESGLLVSNMDSFTEYQHQHAWVWEHQALTRARFCAGDAGIGAQFETIRDSVLRQPRDLEKLRTEIVAMRQKMHDGHPNRTALFDIKHDSGGMVDIEFMVQYLVLAHAAQHPQLTANKGNIALLRLAAELGLIDARLAEKTVHLYRELRRIQHQMRLNNQTPARIDPETLDVSACIALWQQLMQS
ncbi:MAG: bifunctional [glutamate--ammonia ligase]-adenylyl-L-tyrosine phosphorylase/[glutamate--ammonia-ligase] adenylyltransferase [Pseudomonadota bacterium]